MAERFELNELFAVQPELFVQKVQIVQAVQIARFEKTDELAMLFLAQPSALMYLPISFNVSGV